MLLTRCCFFFPLKCGSITTGVIVIIMFLFSICFTILRFVHERFEDVLACKFEFMFFFVKLLTFQYFRYCTRFFDHFLCCCHVFICTSYLGYSDERKNITKNIAIFDSRWNDNIFEILY